MLNSEAVGGTLHLVPMAMVVLLLRVDLTDVAISIV